MKVVGEVHDLVDVVWVVEVLKRFRLDWFLVWLRLGLGVDVEVGRVWRMERLVLGDFVMMRADVHASLIRVFSNRMWSDMWILMIGVGVKSSGRWVDMYLYTYWFCWLVRDRAGACVWLMRAFMC